MPTLNEQLVLIENELSCNGLNTEIVGSAVVASMTNRKPSCMEVKTALGDLADICEVESTATGVFVRPL